MSSARASGVLLHPTSLPASPEHGVRALDAGSGDFGPSAFRFVDWLAAAGQSLWQVLPLNPVGPGYSPYTSVSAHAGSPWLISPAELARAGLLEPAAAAAILATFAPIPAGTKRIDFAASGRMRMALLRQAAQNFAGGRGAAPKLRDEFAHWCEQQRAWLADYALFMAIRKHLGAAAPWVQWPRELAHREPDALRAAAAQLAPQVHFWRFVQWAFSVQWDAVRSYAHERGIRVVGDMPIYVAWDSADVWANADLFALDAEFRPAAVAGVPPDYFSATGQLWGNPLYRWERHAADGFAWWLARLRSALRQADIVRIDHFRAFESYWEVPADATTAVHGRWCPGPGMPLFTALERGIGVPPGGLPLVAEDLGTITPEVIALREAAGLPGMRVLQFAFAADAADLNLPHNFPQLCVAYTGTHDNDTSLGWFASASERERTLARIYLKTDGRQIGWDLIHAASASTARYAIYPLQDVLELSSHARMNAPGVAEGQWGWRFAWDEVMPWHGRRLREISAAHGRNGLPLDFSPQPEGNGP